MASFFPTKNKTILLEYVWLAGDQSLRSKTRTYYKKVKTVNDLPAWNYDGSSCGQAPGNDSEIVLVPCALFNDPFRKNLPENTVSYLVLCKSEKVDKTPALGCNREYAEKIFKNRMHEMPWYGIEQEYTLFEKDGVTPLGWPKHDGKLGYPAPQGPYYCAAGTNNIIGREIVEEHYMKCLEAGIRVSGINAEVMLGQWEYQVGPCEGLSAGDELWMSRYIMERVCEKHNIVVNWDPKPMPGDWNGAGCHTNFSTKKMRENCSKDYVMSLMERFCEKHMEHIKVYGEGNERRLTGHHETSPITEFSFGVANRGCSIRIPRDLHECDYKSGYIEDRRPASNMDPYLVTAKIAETCIDSM
tara:strand:+ start:968 stop:2038 length:1071 start_codon:yes stop_codon:yes gene_type:complete